MVLTRRQVQGLLEAAFNARPNPTRSTIARLAEETGKTKDDIYEWFAEMRSQQGAPPAAAAAVPVTPVRGPRRRAPPVANVNVAAALAPPTPPVARQRNISPIPNAVPNQSRTRLIRSTNLPQQFAVTVEPLNGRTQVCIRGLPSACYPAELVAAFNASDPDEEVSNEEEKIFRKVLLTKIRCQVCTQRMITLKCFGCRAGVCSNCFVNLAYIGLNHDRDDTNITCPFCRNGPQPFQSVATIRM